MLRTQPSGETLPARVAAAEAKQRIRDRLANDDSGSMRRVISGQNLGHANFEPRKTYQQNVGRLAAKTGRLPVILAVDYGYDAFPSGFTATNRLLEAHSRRRGLVSVSMHPPNPWHRSDSHDLRVHDLRRLLEGDQAAHRAWLATLDHVADGLAELRDAGVVVLWRPLHEMNGGWFWWGARQTDGRWVSRDEYFALWRHMHQYFTDQKGLDNLLWVYSAAVQYDEQQKAVDYFYPGDEFVDVLGLDWYSDDLRQLDAYGSYTKLAQLDKPLGLTEFGPLEARDGSFDNTRLLRTLDEHYPQIDFFVYWHSWPGARVALVDNRYATALVRNARIVTLDAATD